MNLSFRSPRHLALLAVAAAVVFTACGCARSVPVKGKVETTDGKLVPNGNVIFVPDKDKGNTSTDEPRANITEQGTYELITNGKPGAPAGWYKVVVNAVEKTEGDNTKPTTPKQLVAQKYNKVETTDLSVEVKPDGTYDLKLAGYSGTAAMPGPMPMPMPK